MAHEKKEKKEKKKPEKTSDEPTKITFELKPVSKKPSRRYKKGSRYDPIIDQFIESDLTLAQVDVEGKDGNYLRTQLNKNIEKKNLTEKIKVSVTNSVLYLEKIPQIETTPTQ